MFNSNAANQSACGSSSPGRGTRELFLAKELFALMTKRCVNLSETETALLSYLGNLHVFLKLAARIGTKESDHLRERPTHRTITNELEDVRAELDMLKADFHDYREQVARDKAEADENAARTAPLANAAAAKNREDRNGGDQLRCKRENVDAVEEEVVVVAHKQPKRSRHSTQLTNSEATSSSTPYSGKELPFPSGGTISRHAPLQRQFFPTPQLYSNSLMLMAMPFPSPPPPVPPSLGSLPSKEDSLKLMFSFNKDFSKADKKEKCPLRQEIFERAYRQFNKHMKNGTQLYNSALMRLNGKMAKED